MLTVGINRAVDLLASAPEEARRRGGEVLREMGAHPGDGEAVVALAGRYGPYLKHGRTNASLPKGKAVEALTMAEAVALLAARAAKDAGKARPAAKVSAKPKAGAKPKALGGSKAGAKAKPAGGKARPAAARPPARKAAGGD